MQDFGAAQALRREILALRRDWVETRRDFGKGEYNLAVLAKALDDFDSAREHFQEAINVFEGLLKDDAEDLAYQYSLATCYRLLADVLWDSADAEKAIAYYESGLAVIERLARENPDVAKYQAELASLTLNLGSLKRDNLPEAAQDLLQQAVDIFRRLFEQYPEIAAYRRNLGVALRELGALQADTGKSQIAAENLRLAEQHFEDLLGEFPGDSHLATQLELTRAALKELGNRKAE
jgi:tetratricopeptide (TPR) repeat protein